MKGRSVNLHKHLVPVFFAVVLTMVVSAPAMSQEATPGMPSGGYPVAIHPGTCDAPTAEPAYTVRDNAMPLTTDDKDAKMVGETMGHPLAETSAKLDVKLDDLTKSPHVIAVHASPDEFGTLVACGEISGIEKDGKLTVALAPVDGSGVSGVALLDRDRARIFDLRKDQTHIIVYVVPAAGGDTSTPMA